MATRLPAILDHLAGLMAGTVAGLDRAIPPNHFVHAKMPVEFELPRTAKAPYPWHLAGIVLAPPDDIEENVAGNEVYRALGFALRIGYAFQMIGEYVQQKEILTDAYAIHRCLSDPDSWVAAVGFARFACSEGQIVVTSVPGAQVDRPELMLILEIPCKLTYREDYS